MAKNHVNCIKTMAAMGPTCADDVWVCRMLLNIPALGDDMRDFMLAE